MPSGVRVVDRLQDLADVDVAGITNGASLTWQDGKAVAGPPPVSAQALADAVAGVTPASIGAATPGQVASAVAAVTPASIGAATPAQVSTAVGLVTPLSIGAATPAQVSAAVAAVTPVSIGAATPAQIAAAIAGVTTSSIGAATPSDVTAAVAGLASTSYVTSAVAGVTTGSIGAATTGALSAEAASRVAGDAAAVQLAPATAQVVLPAANVVPLTVQGFSGGTSDLQQWINGAGSTLVKIGSSGRLIMGADAVARVNFSPTAANQLVVAVRGVAAQSLNLQEWQDSGAAVLAKVDPSGLFSARQVQAIGTVAGSVPAVVQAAASQSADMQRWQDSAAGVKSSVDAFGSLLVRTTVKFGSAAVSAAAPAAAAEGVIVRGFASQSADLQKWQTSAGADVARVDPTGGLFAAQATILGSNAAAVPLSVQGAPSQSTNLQEWKNSAGTTVVTVTSAGGMFTKEIRMNILSTNVGGAAGTYLGLANVGTAPATSPVGGGVLYALAGALRWKGSGGTDTQIAAA